LNDSRFAPIIDVHLDRLAPPSLRTGTLNPPSPLGSSPGSMRSSTSIKSREYLYPASPLTNLHGHSTLSLPPDEPPLKAQTSPRPPPRKLAPPMPISKESRMMEPKMIPLTPTREAPQRPLPRAPRRDMGYRFYVDGQVVYWDFWALILERTGVRGWDIQFTTLYAIHDLNRHDTRYTIHDTRYTIHDTSIRDRHLMT
jgi:hypothetical protein